MPVPSNVVYVRHGESEPNLVHAQERDGILHEQHAAVYERPEWQQRLSEEGVKDAVAAGNLLRTLGFGIETFDQRIASPFLRARETAMYLDPDNTAQWMIDERLKERDWGEFGATPHEMRARKFAYADRQNRNNKWYARVDGGECLADGVLQRVRDHSTALHQDAPGDSVLIVAHGETIMTARYFHEQMLPEEWMAMYDDPAQEIKNGTILQYTSEDPGDRTHIAKSLQWFRLLYPRDLEHSPFGGQWQEIPVSRTFTPAELATQLTVAPPLIKRLQQTN